MSVKTVELPYGPSVINVQIPEKNLLGVYSPVDLPPVADISMEVERALAHPIGSPTLRELVAGKKNVVIVADDNTRLTPTDKIIPILLREMNAAGVKDEQITIVIALGTHRDMTDREILDKFGEEVVRRVKIVNHDYKSAKALVDLGMTDNGTPVSINKLVYEADFKIGVGSIVPHHIPGYAGGAKIVQPGVSGEITTGSTHLLSVRAPRSLLGVEDNQVRRELNKIARTIGMHTIFNTVLDRNGKVIQGFFGDIEEAFKAGVEVSKAVYMVRVPQEADIVLASSHPCDLEFWQAHKTLYAADRAVKEKGIIIVVTPCPEGVAKTHQDMVEYAGLSSATIKKMVEDGLIEDSVAAALAIAWAQVREREQVYIVSGGVPHEAARKLGFVPFNTVEEALNHALREVGEEAKIAVLTHAPDTLPVIDA
ncbi:MAG: larA 1 [Peptococcaceae bacterium]|nr:larA 1 [Peptococcaceae bacterium]